MVSLPKGGISEKSLNTGCQSVEHQTPDLPNAPCVASQLFICNTVLASHASHCITVGLVSDKQCGPSFPAYVLIMDLWTCT